MWIVVVPGATPVTGTVIVELEPPLGKNVWVAATVAAAGLLELTATVMPLGGAFPERVTTKACVVVPTMVRLGGAYARVAPTTTCAVALLYPMAVAVMVTVPTSRPVTCG